MNAPGERLAFSLDTYNPANMTAMDADELPTATSRRVQAADGTTVVGPTMVVSKVPGTTGKYEVKGVVPVSASAGDVIYIDATARLSSVDYPATIGRAVVEATPPTAAAIADAILARALAGGSNTGRTVRDALRALRNKVSVANGVLTVYQEDDMTEAWHGAVTTDAAAVNITGIDPS